MVLHYAEDPAAALAEAARVLCPGGLLVVVDLAPHANADCLQRLAHRWPGFPEPQMERLLGEAGLARGPWCECRGRWRCGSGAPSACRRPPRARPRRIARGGA